MKNILIVGAIVIVLLTAILFLVKPKTASTLQEQIQQTRIQKMEEFKRNGGIPPESQETGKVENTDQIPTVAPENGRIAKPDTNTQPPAPVGKLKVGNFTGKLEEVNTGCFSDGECYVVVDGKHITTLMGWNQNEVGSVQGVEGFGDLESHVGEQVEVYAQDNNDETYTLYGSTGFYVKLK